MAVQPLDEALDSLVSQCLSRRIPQSSFLALLHQLLRRFTSTPDVGSSTDVPVDQPSAAGAAANILLAQILGQPLIDPLLVEYLQALVYGSATRSGVTPDQGPVTDVITVTLHLLALIHSRCRDEGSTSDALLQLVPALETMSSVIGQGLLVTFAAPFNVSNPSFVALVLDLFIDSPSASASSPSQSTSPTELVASLQQASIAFIAPNLRLLSLASQPSISAPQKLLSPRVGITLLMNIAQGLLAHVHQRLIALKDSTIRDNSKALDSSLATNLVDEIDTVLESMNPAWKSEIALLRSITSQINLNSDLRKSLSETASDRDPLTAGGRTAETLDEAQKRASWDHFVDVGHTTSLDPSSSSAASSVEPEIALLLHTLVDRQIDWTSKLDSVKALFLARRRDAAPSVTLELSLTAFYFELLTAAIHVCASVVETPAAFKGAEAYSTLWRNALCGLLPEIVLQLEQWLDAHPDLPVRGSRQDAPHVRVESALKATLAKMSQRLQLCETGLATIDSAGPTAAGADNTLMTDPVEVVGVDTPPVQPIKAWLLRSFIEHSLARPEAITDEFPGGRKLASEVQSLSQSQQMDAQLEGLTLPAYFESRFASGEDPAEILARVAADPGTHFAFAHQLTAQISAWLEQHDLESMARWCKVLSEDLSTLDTMMIYINPIELINPLATILDRSDIDHQASDEPSTLSNILLFLQLLCHRYSISPARIVSPTGKPEQPFLAKYLSFSSVCYALSDLSEDEKLLVGRWIQALFGNEGISDDLIQASPPTALLRLSPLLFSQSIQACIYGVIDLETLRGGLSYFLQDLLSFALPGALRWLLREVLRVPLLPIPDLLNSAGLQSALDVPSSDGTLANGLSRKANSRTVYLEVLSLVLDTDSCPDVVRQLVSRSFDRFVTSSRLKNFLGGAETFNLDSLKARMEASSTTSSLLSARSGWLRNVLASTTLGPNQLTNESIGSDSILSTNKTMHECIEALGCSVVINAVTIQLISSSSKSTEKALASWAAMSPRDIPTMLLQLDLTNVPSSSVTAQPPTSSTPASMAAIVAPIVRFLVLLLGLVHASDVLHKSNVAAASVAASNEFNTSAGLFDDEPESFDQSPPAKPPVSADDLVDLISLKLFRLKNMTHDQSHTHTKLWTAYLEAFQNQQSCLDDDVKTKLFKVIGLSAE